jgi:hypothetical protein
MQGENCRLDRLSGYAFWRDPGLLVGHGRSG